MTARAFLGLSDDLRDSFAKAQDDETLRYLRVEIVDGDSLSVVGSRQKGDLQTDFDSLAKASGESAHPAATVPCLFIFLLSDVPILASSKRSANRAQTERTYSCSIKPHMPHMTAEGTFRT